MNCLQNPGSKLRNRFFLLLGFGLLGFFGSRRAIIGGSSLAGAGALAVLVLAFVAGLRWQEKEKVPFCALCVKFRKILS